MTFRSLLVKIHEAVRLEEAQESMLITSEQLRSRLSVLDQMNKELDKLEKMLTCGKNGEDNIVDVSFELRACDEVLNLFDVMLRHALEKIAVVPHSAEEKSVAFGFYKQFAQKYNATKIRQLDVSAREVLFFDSSHRITAQKPSPKPLIATETEFNAAPSAKL